MAFPSEDIRTTNPILSGFVFTIKQSTQVYDAPKLSVEVPTEGVTSGTYYKLATDTFTGDTAVMPAGALGARAVGGDFVRLRPATTSTGTFSCIEYGFEDWVDDTQRRGNQVNVDLDEIAAERALHWTLRARELRVQSVLQATGSITNNTTLSGTSQWSDYDNSTPTTDITTAIQSVFDAVAYDPATMILFAHTNQAVMLKLRFHPELQAHFGGGKGDSKMVTDQQLMEFFGFEELIVSNSYKNNAKPGQTVSLAAIWSDDFLVGLKPRTPGVQRAIGHASFVAADVAATTYREEPRTDVHLVSHEMDEVLVNDTSFYLIKDCLA